MAHYISANKFSRKKFYLGVPSVVFSAIVGTGVLASIGQNISIWGKLIGGIISMIVAILTALQTFLTYGEKSMLHKFSGTNYEILKREIQTALTINYRDEEISNDIIIELQKRMDMLAKEAPEIPEQIWEQVLKNMPPQKQLWERVEKK